jgi:hypothetical protein
MSNKPNDGGPAFPLQSAGPDFAPGYAGMTLRDYFAAKAMQGLLANPGGPVQANAQVGWDYTNCTGDDIARVAYTMADTMLAARSA